MLIFEMVAAVERLMNSGFTGDIYRQAVAEVLHIDPSEVTQEQRMAVKQASFGTRYATRVGF